MILLIPLILLLPYIIRFVWITWGYSKSDYYQITHKPLGDLLSDKGAYGEYLIYRHMDKRIQGEHKWLFNVYLPRGQGRTTEVDVMLFHSSGIYVFESKNYQGWIFGSEDRRVWTQCLKSRKGRTSIKNRFLNPIMQNKLHISCLQKELGDSTIPLYSAIIFGNRCNLKEINQTSNQHSVLLLSEVSNLVQHINNARSSFECDWMTAYAQLLPMSQVSEAVKQQHIDDINHEIQNDNNVPYSAHIQPHYEAPHTMNASYSAPPRQGFNETQNASNDTASRICPRCGGKLVMRTARTGRNAGQKFWGCFNYPKCHYTQKLDQ